MDSKTAAAALFDAMPKIRRMFKGHPKNFKHDLSKVVLNAIDKHPDLAMKHYADHLHIAKSNFSNIVDQLNRDGLLLRAPHESDRRKIILRTTEKGRRKLEKIRRDMVDMLEKRLRALTPGELEELVASIEGFTRILDKLEGEKTS